VLGRFLSDDALFWAHVSVGKVKLNNNMQPVNAAAKHLTQGRLTCGEEEKPNRIGNILCLSIAESRASVLKLKKSRKNKDLRDFIQAK
jgi:hypothetical protein